MAREYPRFLFSNPTNTKSQGPFVVHTLEPICIFRITPKETARLVDVRNLFIVEGEFVCELLKTTGPNKMEALNIGVAAISWFQSQDLANVCFKKWFYTLADNNGANSLSSYKKFEIGDAFISFEYLYRVDEIDEKEYHIIADRIRLATSEDRKVFPYFGPQ